jgi:short-subunit dehydrogenase
MSPTSSSSRTALVTGASSGIGKAIAEQFARDGVNLVISARSADQLAALAAQWQSQYGVQVKAIPADLAQPGAAQALFEAVAAGGIALDFLVNNAGYGGFGLFADTALEGELAMMRLNMEALTVLSKLFLPQVASRRGRIMNVASTAAFQPGPYMAVYYATKAYVLSFTEALAAELAGTGVTVTAFCPGPTASGFQDRAVMQDSALVKGRKLPTSEEVGLAGYRAMMAGKRVYIPGLMNWLMAQSVRFSPRTVVTTMVKYISRPK